MSQSNEFDLQSQPPPEEEPGGGGPRLFYWLVGMALMAFVAFAGGMAYFTLNQRLPDPTTPATAIVLQTPTLSVADALSTVNAAVGTPTPLSPEAATAQAVISLTTVAETAVALGPTLTATPLNLPTAAAPTPTVAEVPSNTPVPLPPTPTAPALPTPCGSPPDILFSGQPLSELGCPLEPVSTVWSAIEQFERGYMYWRSDIDSAYVLGGSTNGTFSVVQQKWENQPVPSRGVPPADRTAPERGFGFVWGSDEAVFQTLGWGVGPEMGICVNLQPFERGFVMLTSAVEFCTPDQLFNHAHRPEWPHFGLVLQMNPDNRGGRWFTIGASGQPSNVPIATATLAATPTWTAVGGGATATATGTQGAATLTATPSAAATIAPPSNAQRRPDDQGLFTARRSAGVALDGKMEEWTGLWLPIVTIVQGGENFGGPNDLGGSFQLAWSPDGLYVAIRVQDETYRPGPDGTDMWKGDGLELHFDRDLAGDFSDESANVDDFQIGISYVPETNQIRLYRWLPQSIEGAYVGNGAVVRNDQGYNLEVLLPWSIFEINGGAMQANQTYGFNLSINDNDSDEPAQQTVVSASAKRTTHDNPTEWGTLLIGP